MIKRAILLSLVAALTSSCAVLGFAGACQGTEIIGEFEQVGDLVEQANVQTSDVVIGSISDIKLADWTARVTMCLDGEHKIPSDVRAVVRTTSLLGEKFVDLKVEGSGPPYLADGDVIALEDTGKATELEDVFAQLASILGTGNLEQLNRFTGAQARILENDAGNLRRVLSELREFTDVLAGRSNTIALSIDNLDAVSRTILDDSTTLRQFLGSFADSSGVLADQKEELQNLLLALDRFTDISVALLDQTESGLNKQFDKLRPVLRTAVANSANVAAALQTLARFAQLFPESVPGDYVQLDVCQAQPESFGQGITCPQSVENDDPDGVEGSRARPSNSLELILHGPLGGAR